MRRATWLLWLMLALLPMRGWAIAGMGLPPAAQDRTLRVAMADESAQHESAQDGSAMPCHQADADAEAGSNCQACDWCHAALAVPPTAGTLGMPRLSDAPPMTPQLDTGRPAVGGLERPPRSRPA